MNIVVVKGALSRTPEQRELPSGYHLVAFEVTVREEGQAAASVPVVWFDAPASSTKLDAGAEVLVTGRVRRRFFRTSAGTGSRTEIVADLVLATSQRKRVERALVAAADRLEVGDT